MNKRKIEIFSAGCPACDEAVSLVKGIVCPSCEVEVLNMNDSGVAARAKQYGINRVPSVVVGGKLAACCAGGGVEVASLRAAGVGVPLP